MAEGLLVTPAFVKAVREHERRLNNEPVNRVQKDRRWPILSGGAPIKFFRLTGSTYIYRGSHPNGVAAEEVRADTTDHGRITWKTVRTTTLWCGNNGVYVQRDGGTVGNNPGDPDGGDPENPPPCPPNCTFTGNSNPIQSTVPTAPAWWYLGSTAASQQTGSFSQSASSSAMVYAVTGMNQNGLDFTIGQWESVFVGVTVDDITGSYGNITIDGIGTVAASVLCTEGISEGSTVDVRFRELGGAGGFVIVGRICCPGYDA